MRHSNSAMLARYAAAHRAAPTASEALLWGALSGSKTGVAFRRQLPLGGRYIGDFVAPLAKLVVEVDGGWHASRQRADARRDRYLARLGYGVLRLPAELVEQSLGEAVALVLAALGR